MLKRPVTYTDFNGDKVTEDLYFNLSRVDLMDMEFAAEGGMVAFLTGLMERQNPQEMYTELKRWILTGYGVKSEDGKRFMKSDQIRADFECSAAYDQVFIDLTQSEDEIMQFFLSIIPPEFAKQVDNQPQDKPRGLPPTPPKRDLL